MMLQWTEMVLIHQALPAWIHASVERSSDEVRTGSDLVLQNLTFLGTGNNDEQSWKITYMSDDYY